MKAILTDEFDKQFVDALAKREEVVRGNAEPQHHRATYITTIQNPPEKLFFRVAEPQN